jgi:hypothetical protein
MQSLQVLYTFVLRAEVATIFGPSVVAISTRNTKVYKICELCKAIFSAFYKHFATKVCNCTQFSTLFPGIYFFAKTKNKSTMGMDHLHYRLNFDLNKSRQKFHHSLKEHHKN